MRRRRKFSAAERQFITERAGSRCEYCQTLLDYSPESFDIEHIIPLVKGGSNELDNLALACGGCNGRKRDATGYEDPVTGIFIPLFHPRTDKWTDHFDWSDDIETITGITPKGKATIAMLHLNRAGLVNLRKALKLTGVHPAISRWL